MKKLKLGSVAELRNAMHIARDAHRAADSAGRAEQLRVVGPDAGKPYFESHVIPVMNMCAPWAKPAAALHDVLEDCGVRWLPHIQASVTSVTFAAVKLLTRGEETYFDYIQGILDEDEPHGMIARHTKLYDLIHNHSTWPEGDMRGRYLHALKDITAAIVDRNEVGWDCCPLMGRVPDSIPEVENSKD